MKPIRVALLLAALAMVPLLVSDLRAQQPPATTTTTTTPTISSRTTTVGGLPVGEVLVGDTVVIRLTQPAGGYTAGQRADIVAARLTSLRNQGYTWQNVRVATVGNSVVLMMGNTILVTADPAEARYNNITPTQLATTWQNNTQAALRGAPVVGGTGEQWPDWTNSTTKIVPIVNVGTPGISLGAAQVTGPQQRVDQVRAVLQVEVVFQRTARILVFVPSSEISNLKRVQGVAVSALLQYQLFQF